MRSTEWGHCDIVQGLMTKTSGSSQHTRTLTSSRLKAHYSLDLDPDSIPSFSATLPFAGNGLSFHANTDTEPFYVVLSLGANLVQPSPSPPWLVSSNHTMMLNNTTTQEVEGNRS